MESKSLIISLIQQDLKHNQLILGLERLDFSSEKHPLPEIIAGLMNIPPDKISDQWYDIYFSFLEKAAALKITETGNNLEELAEECFEMLFNSNTQRIQAP